jgi:hypothetical protein
MIEAIDGVVGLGLRQACSSLYHYQKSHPMARTGLQRVGYSDTYECIGHFGLHEWDCFSATR